LKHLHFTIHDPFKGIVDPKIVQKKKPYKS